MTDSKFLDSSAWLSYFYAENKEIKPIIDSDILILTSTLSIFEIKNKFTKDKIDFLKLEHSIKVIKNRSLIIDVDLEIAERAVEFSIKNNLSAVDSLIYSSALKNNSVLITLDNDFRSLNNVLILDKNS